MAKNLLSEMGRIHNVDELLRRGRQFQASPGDRGKKYLVIIAAGREYYFYGVHRGSHHSAANAALRLHSRKHSTFTEVCAVLGRCNRRSCKCGGTKRYLLAMLQDSGGSGWGVAEGILPQNENLGVELALLYEAAHSMQWLHKLMAERARAATRVWRFGKAEAPANGAGRSYNQSEQPGDEPGCDGAGFSEETKQE